jgi:hypothetical protein
MTTRRCETACLWCKPQSSVPFRALDDSLGISTLTPDARTVGLCDRKDAALYRLLLYPSASRRRISGPSCKPHFSCFGKVRGQNEVHGTMDRPMEMNENVSFCHNLVRRKGGRGPLTDGFLRGMQL